MKYEAWRITFQDSEQAARAAWQMAQESEQRNAELIAECNEAEAAVAELMDAERDAVRECERIASRHIANAQHVEYQIRNRYPQHFEEE